MPMTLILKKLLSFGTNYPLRGGSGGVRGEGPQPSTKGVKVEQIMIGMISECVLRVPIYLLLSEGFFGPAGAPRGVRAKKGGPP